ncbi:hypothetical protein [Dokdonella soli]
MMMSCCVSAHSVAADWLQFGYDAAHSGNNAAETTITAADVSQRITLYANPFNLPAIVDSAPVYARGVATANGTRNLLFLLGSDTTEDFWAKNSTLMAIDADTGSIVWSHVISALVINGQTSSQHASSSPAIDPAKQYVYSFGIDGYAHKYRIGDGVEMLTPGPAGWPQQVTLKPYVEKVASGLTIATWKGTSYLEVVTSGRYGDGGDYQGHLVSINLDTGARTVFNFMCSNVSTLLAEGSCPTSLGGAWGRGGATFDSATGRIYVTSGNGIFDADTGGTNWGDSVLALAPNGTGLGANMPYDSYTPSNFQYLYTSDLDLGSISLAILPAPAGSIVSHLGMQVGKDAVLRLIDLDNMSGAGASAHVGGELQLLNVQQGGSWMSEQPAVWVNPADGSTWLFVGNGYGLSAVRLGLDGSHRPVLSYAWNVSDHSTSPIVANGVLYYLGGFNGGIVARDPLTGTMLGTSPTLGPSHWQSPILADGAIYVTDSANRLWRLVLDRIFKDGFDGP